MNPNDLPTNTRNSILRALAGSLETYFDTDLQDEAFEHLLAAGIDTDSDDTIDAAEDLALSLKVEALDHFLAELGWTLAPRTEPSILD